MQRSTRDMGRGSEPTDVSRGCDNLNSIQFYLLHFDQAERHSKPRDKPEGPYKSNGHTRIQELLYDDIIIS
jgi:hypothetical protein